MKISIPCCLSILCVCCVSGLVVAQVDNAAHLVADIDPVVTTDGSEIERIISIDGTLFFAADDGVNGEEMWKCEPPYTNCVMLADLEPEGNSYPVDLTNCNGTLFLKLKPSSME